MYGILLIFLSIPLIFSHFFARLGSGFIIENGIGYFESVKVYFFLPLLLIATIEVLLTKWEYIEKYPKKPLKNFFALLLAIFLLGVFFYSRESYDDIYFGIGEKQHGLIFLMGILWTGFLLTLLDKREIEKISSVIILSGVLVAGVALIESLGYNIFTGSSYITRPEWGFFRSTSTLGNPNYVAGFLLMILPLIFHRESLTLRWRYLLFLFFLLGIFTTGSVIGMSLAVSYTLFLVGKRFLGKIIHILLPLLLGSIFLLILGLTYESEKWLSLLSRFILMKEVIFGSFDSFISLFIGHGPNSVIEYFDQGRSPEVDVYFPPNLTIDSSHNIFIDIFMKYGILGIIGLFWYLRKNWKYYDTSTREACILCGVFFSLNIPVLSHILLFIYCISRKGEPRKKLL